MAAIAEEATLVFQDLEPMVWTEEEQKGVDVLRSAVEAELGDQKDALIKDELTRQLLYRPGLLRFLRARHSISDSTKMLLDAIKYLGEWDLEKQRRQVREDTGPKFDIARAFSPCGVHGVDRRGVPVYYGRLGLMDSAGIVREAGMDRYLRGSVLDQVIHLESIERASQAAGKHFVNGIVVLDFEGFDWTRISAGVPPFNEMVQILDRNFPERLYVCYCTRAPWLFSMIFSLVKPFLSEDTVRKVRILGTSEDTVKALEEHIDLDNIPDWLGGNNNGWPFGAGGDVPVGSGATTEAAKAAIDEAAKRAAQHAETDEGKYRRSITVSRRDTESVEVTVKPGGTLAFEFILEGYDVDYSVVAGDKTVVEKKRVFSDKGPERGEYKNDATEDTAVKILFDNTYSMLRSKVVKMNVFVA